MIANGMAHDGVWHSLGARWLQLQTQVAVNDDIDMAWMTDAIYIRTKLMKAKAMVDSCIRKLKISFKPANELAVIGGHCIEALEAFQRQGRRPLTQGAHRHLVSPAYAKPVRHTNSSSAADRVLLKPTQTAESITKGPAIKLATFGWWEVAPVNGSTLRALTGTLARLGIHICVVTGLPVEQALDKPNYWDTRG